MFYYFNAYLLECYSRPHLTDLLFHFSDCAIQVTSDSFLLVSAQQEVSFAKVAIDAALDGNIVTSVHQMVTSADWWILGAQMLF